jgi:arginyl-tRNA synthetase
MEPFLTQIATAVAETLGCDAQKVRSSVQASGNPERGDLSLPCFPLAAATGNPGKDGAMAVAEKIGAIELADVSFEASGPFVNIRLAPDAVAREVLSAVWTQTPYGGSDEGKGKTIVIDFSSPNIAKPFHLGHLRSTVIGWSIGQLYRTLGYTVVGVNHLGDWGTQFGFMIAAWQRWKDEAEARIAAGEKDIEVFVDYYAKINALAEQDPTVRDEARGWFKKLEGDDPEAMKLWQYFVDRSKAEFDRVYQILGISHESEAGEAFYNDKMPAMVQRLKDSGLLVDGKTKKETAEAKVALVEKKVRSLKADLAKSAAKLPGLEGKKLAKEEKRHEKLTGQVAKQEAEVSKLTAWIPAEDDGLRPQGVDLSAEKMGFAILLKTDGGTTYTTRDLTAAFYRAETYSPHKLVYVVGNAQRDHFVPWFKVIEKMKQPWASGLHHVGFGKYLGMSTRKGTSVSLSDVLDGAYERAKVVAREATKKVDLSDEEMERVARAIGTGAIKFFDLRAERTKDIDLSLKADPARPECGICKQNMPIPGELVCQPCVDSDRKPIDLDRLLDLKGDTGPYLQFAYARLCGILRRYQGDVNFESGDPSLLSEPESQALLKVLGDFPARVKQAAEAHEPSVISRYVIELSQKTHSFVHHHRVIDAAPTDEQAAAGATAESLRATRVLLVTCAKKVIAEALDLLGIEALERM